MSDRYRQPWDDLLTEMRELRLLAERQLQLLAAILEAQERIEREIVREQQ